MSTTVSPQTFVPYRLQFLDVMKGGIMILLAAEMCQVYSAFYYLPATGIGKLIVDQFYHHAWHGLHFWDLVQPSFMLIAGTAMYISFARKEQQGISWRDNLPHILNRVAKLFVLGMVILSIQAGKVVWEYYNVLSQLAFTTLIAYLIIRRSITFMLLFSLALIVVTELCYRYFPLPGYADPFGSMEHNFGAWLDTFIVGYKNQYGWVTFNAVPTTAHTIWGVCIGKVLFAESTKLKKLQTMILCGVIGLVIGYTLDWSGFSPVIKRICTSAFIFASGGWVLLIMAFIYWLTDIKAWNKYAWIFTVVGMNAIFIYLFFETVGYKWLNGAVAVYAGWFLDLFRFSVGVKAIGVAFVVLLAEWYLCYWLYKKKIFFKL
ncbi:MAG TPA: DUF5009 domain-containing protein [Sphingobacterium sp.]|nr:DUF5009 domain-containing protein [Sphingobacterium sp.]